MGGSATSFLTARLLTPDYFVQAADNAISCPLWQDGALVAPTQAGSTVSVYNGNSTAIVSAAPVTVTGSIATYTVLAASLPTTLPRGMGWRVEWSLIIPSVTPSPRVFRNAAGLTRSALVPVVTDADLFRRESGLNPAGAAPVSSLTDYQDYIDEAWITLHGRLVGKGSLPHLIMEPSALREPHLTLALHLIFQDFRTRLAETWREKAEDYANQYKAAWSELVFEYDASDSGQSDGRRKRAAGATRWLMAID